MPLKGRKMVLPRKGKLYSPLEMVLLLCLYCPETQLLPGLLSFDKKLFKTRRSITCHLARGGFAIKERCGSARADYSISLMLTWLWPGNGRNESQVWNQPLKLFWVVIFVPIHFQSAHTVQFNLGFFTLQSFPLLWSSEKAFFKKQKQPSLEKISIENKQSIMYYVW